MLGLISSEVANMRKISEYRLPSGQSYPSQSWPRSQPPTLSTLLSQQYLTSGWQINRKNCWPSFLDLVASILLTYYCFLWLWSKTRANIRSTSNSIELPHRAPNLPIRSATVTPGLAIDTTESNLVPNRGDILTSVGRGLSGLRSLSGRGGGNIQGHVGQAHFGQSVYHQQRFQPYYHSVQQIHQPPGWHFNIRAIFLADSHFLSQELKCIMKKCAQ